MIDDIFTKEATANFLNAQKILDLKRSEDPQKRPHDLSPSDKGLIIEFYDQAAHYASLCTTGKKTFTSRHVALEVLTQYRYARALRDSFYDESPKPKKPATKQPHTSKDPHYHTPLLLLEKKLPDSLGRYVRAVREFFSDQSPKPEETAIEQPDTPKDPHYQKPPLLTDTSVLQTRIPHYLDAIERLKRVDHLFQESLQPGRFIPQHLALAGGPTVTLPTQFTARQLADSTYVALGIAAHSGRELPKEASR